MTDGKRQLILARLFDRGLLPWECREIDATTWETLSDREREVFAEEIAKEVERQLAEMDDILRTAPPGMSRFARLKTLLWLRWRSLRMAWAKKGRDVIGDGIGGYARVVKGTDDEAPHAQGERGMNMPMRALPPSKRETK